MVGCADIAILFHPFDQAGGAVVTDPQLPLQAVDLNAQEHKSAAFRAKSPLARIPALEFDDGRVLTETRAICTWIEGQHPEPNLMGVDATERAFIEMADRRIEWYFLLMKPTLLMRLKTVFRLTS